jgi:hypothetical protein
MNGQGTLDEAVVACGQVVELERRQARVALCTPVGDPAVGVAGRPTRSSVQPSARACGSYSPIPVASRRMWAVHGACVAGKCATLSSATATCARAVAEAPAACQDCGHCGHASTSAAAYPTRPRTAAWRSSSSSPQPATQLAVLSARGRVPLTQHRVLRDQPGVIRLKVADPHGNLIQPCCQPNDSSGDLVILRTHTAPARHHTKIIPQ